MIIGALLDVRYISKTGDRIALVEWHNSYLELKSAFCHFSDISFLQDMETSEACPESIVVTALPVSLLRETGEYVDPETVWSLSSSTRHLRGCQQMSTLGDDQNLKTLNDIFNKYEVLESIRNFPRMTTLDKSKIETRDKIIISINNIKSD